MGFEGANVMFDAWVHPLMMGLEEHLLNMFRGDFEFHDGAAPSHLGSAARRAEAEPAAPVSAVAVAEPPAPVPAAATAALAAASPAQIVVPAGASVSAPWTPDAEKELRKIPFFVRGKAKRNTEAYAGQRGLTQITVETLYDAKAHFSR
jgi:light-independent protochlorophyllide reductase subunit B